MRLTSVAGTYLLLLPFAAGLTACGASTASSNVPDGGVVTMSEGGPDGGGATGSDGASDDASNTQNVDICSAREAGLPPCTMPSPTFEADVLPILNQRCNDCHSGIDGGPWPLNDYQDLVDWKPLIFGDILDCSMPPADAGAPLSSDEQSVILDWVACGMPR